MLRGLTLRLGSDRTVCITGPSGTGKSTVLKTVFGLLKLWIDPVGLSGRDITGEEPEDLVRVGMDYVPQMGNVFFSLIIDENFRMGGVARSEGLRVRIGKLYGQFSILDEKRSAKARAFSGGRRQVLASTRVLMMEPEVLLINEPSAGFVPNIVQSVFEDVRRVNELGTAALVVGRGTCEGPGIFDRNYVLDQETVTYEGDADGLLDDPEVSRLYMGGVGYKDVESG